jgi:hypothetical protein
MNGRHTACRTAFSLQSRSRRLKSSRPFPRCSTHPTAAHSIVGRTRPANPAICSTITTQASCAGIGLSGDAGRCQRGRGWVSGPRYGSVAGWERLRSDRARLIGTRRSNVSRRPFRRGLRARRQDPAHRQASPLLQLHTSLRDVAPARATPGLVSRQPEQRLRPRKDRT